MLTDLAPLTASSPVDPPSGWGRLFEWFNKINQFLAPIDDIVSGTSAIPNYTVNSTSTSFLDGGLVVGQEYDSTWLADNGISQSDIPPGFVPIFNALGVFSGIKVDPTLGTENFFSDCFPAGTMIDIWPIDPGPEQDGVYDQDKVHAGLRSKPIEELEYTDTVVSYDKQGNLVPGKVSKLFTNTTSEFVRLIFSDDRDNVVVTPGHRFLTETGDYMEIGHMLRLGGGTARVVDVDGSVVEATGEALVYSAETAHLFPEAQTKTIAMQGNTVLKEQVEAGWQTYNFEVREHHNYVAGGIRVHNDSILAQLEEGDQLLALNDDLTDAAVLRDVGADLSGASDGDMDVVVLEGFRDPHNGVFSTQLEVVNLYRDDGETYSLQGGGSGNLAEAVNAVFAASFASTAAGSVTSEGGPDQWNTGSVTDDFEELLFDDVAGVPGDEPTPRSAVRALYDESVAYIDGVPMATPQLPNLDGLTGQDLVDAVTTMNAAFESFATAFNTAFATGVLSYELSDGSTTKTFTSANSVAAASFLLGLNGDTVLIPEVPNPLGIGDPIFEEATVNDFLTPLVNDQTEFTIDFGSGIASGWDATGTIQTWDGEVTWEEDGQDLLLRIATGGGSAEWLRIEDVYANGGHDEIEGVRFADGAEIQLAQLGATIRKGFDGTSNADVIVGNDLDNAIRGFHGDDILFGRGGSDTILGGLHEDYIEGNTGDDTIDGWQGSDTIYGNRGNDTINGGGAKDLIFGGANNDTIDGGEWKDQINGGRGNDTLTGGSDTGVSDIFVFAHDGLDGNDTITDFEVGFDKLILGDSANGFLDISDVTVSGSANAIVSYGSTNITLTGVSVSTVTSNASQIFGDDSDFLF